MKYLICLLYTSFMLITAKAQTDMAMLRATLRSNAADTVKLQTYKEIFTICQYAQPDTCICYLESGLNYFTDRKYKPGMAQLTNMLALMDGMQGRGEAAKKRFAAAYVLFAQLGDRKGIAAVHNGSGILESRTGNYSEAIKHFMAALHEFELQHDTDGIANTYLKLGVANEEGNNLDRSLDYLDKALLLVRSYGAKGTAPAAILNNLGIVYAKKGDMHKAIAYFEEAISGRGHAKLTGDDVQALINIGMAYNELHDEKSALDYFDKALSLTDKNKLPEEYSRLLINRSALLSKDHPDEGLKNLKEALTIAKEIGQKLLMTDIYSDMTAMYVKQGDYKAAFATLQAQKALSDTLFNIARAKEIASLQSVYELQRSNTRVYELEELGRKNKLKKDIIFIVATVLGVAIVLLLFLYSKSKRLNELLAKRERELQKSNTVKDKLFSIIGHDLRGPVGNIPAMLQLLHTDAVAESERQYLLDRLVEHSQASVETLDKLLYWGQSQIKGVGIRQERFSAGEYVKNSMKLVKNSAEEKHITITDKTPCDIQIYADTAHFDFIIRNLLSNAVKFTYNNGHVEIGADSTKQEGFVIFSIQDDGMGISKEASRLIFEPFGSSATGTANEKGTSIGLMLCRQFVEENGGRIWVESEKDRGATFYFSLKTS